MTRQHFTALAEALAARRPHAETPDHLGSSGFRHAVGQWRADVDAVAAVCATFNGLFDRYRFLAACGVRPEEIH